MTIKDVCEKFDVSADTLRYYEKVGLINPVPKENGIRKYGKPELDNIEFVLCMRSAGIPIDVLAEYIKLVRDGEHTAEQRRNMLIEQRVILKEKLDDMQKAYEKLNYKIDVYYSKINPIEEKLINKK